MTTANRTWFVRATSPKDWFDDLTMTVREWLEKEANPVGPSREDKESEFLEAKAEVEKHDSWDNEERHEPHVGYDPIEDTFYFIFKLDNNGTTFLYHNEIFLSSSQTHWTINTSAHPRQSVRRLIPVLFGCPLPSFLLPRSTLWMVNLISPGGILNPPVATAALPRRQ